MSATVSLIAAIGENGELGAKGKLLWHLPDDFAWFINHTKGHTVVMGRKTMESLGTPLKNRRNLVVSRNHNLKVEGFEIYPDMDSAMRAAYESEKEEIFVIGGGVVYTDILAESHRVYLTRVHAKFPDADAFFPELDDSWKLKFREFHEVDAKHAHPFEFEIWEKE